MHILNMKQLGYTVVEKCVDIDLINRVVSDFDEWSSLEQNGFTAFNGERVTNFHMHNKNTMDLVTNFHVNEILKRLFEKDPVVYSSLFFREGTSQHYHRDTPHFYTNPIDQYYGVWYALEDVYRNAGPLKYYVGSHTLEVPDGHATFNKVYENQYNQVNLNEDFRCIIEYNRKIEDLCKTKNLNCVDQTNYKQIKKGDVIIWHPKLLHGGSEIIDKTLTRYSMVTHNVPINTQVFNASHFFAKHPTETYLENKCTFKYVIHNKIPMVDHNCKPRVHKSYV